MSIWVKGVLHVNMFAPVSHCDLRSLPGVPPSFSFQWTVEPEFHSAVKVSSGHCQARSLSQPLWSPRATQGLQGSWPAVTFTEKAGPDWHIYGDLCKNSKMLEAQHEDKGKREPQGRASVRELVVSRTDRWLLGWSTSSAGRFHFSVATYRWGDLPLSLKVSSRDVLWAGRHKASSPVSSLQAVLLYCNSDLPEPRPGCLQEPYPEPFIGSESVSRTAQNLSIKTKNSSIRIFWAILSLGRK